MRSSRLVPSGRPPSGRARAAPRRSSSLLPASSFVRSRRAPRRVPLPVSHSPLVQEVSLRAVRRRHHLARVQRSRGGHRQERDLVRGVAAREPGRVVDVVEPSVPLPRHRGGVVIVEIRVLDPPVPSALVRRVLEVLVPVRVLADERALAGLELPARRELARAGGGRGRRTSGRAGGGRRPGWGGENGVSVVKLGAGIDDGFPFQTGTVGFEGDVRCDSRGLRRFGRAGRPPPPPIGSGDRSGARGGAVGGGRGRALRCNIRV